MIVVPRPASSESVRRAGFTMVELLFVIVIGAIVSSMAVNGASAYMARQGARNARDAFVYLSHRARSSAIERGRPVSLLLDDAADRAGVFEGCTTLGAQIETLTFTGEFEVDVLTPGGVGIRVCYSPRGFALDYPNTTIEEETVVGFLRGADTARAAIRVLGQVEAR